MGSPKLSLRVPEVVDRYMKFAECYPKLPTGNRNLPEETFVLPEVPQGYPRLMTGSQICLK